ncbi:uncharacterized protein PG986_006279 [Apiospora aurea]|uniref:Uncharacterized protein n=1 Tax=Apiospora aurea TaxID=335848 RepID=A0ABR1QKR1_9PEZI
MRLSLLIQAAISCRFIGAVDGQVVSYITSMVTTCLDIIPAETPGAASPGGNPTASDPQSSNPQAGSPQAGSPQADPGNVSYSMPACAVCGCSTCTVTSTFTTSYSAFCPTGISDQTYTITETYVGMSSLPVFATPTAVPYGFTVEMATCTKCGAQPLTVAITFPSGGSPFVPAATTMANGGQLPMQTSAPGAVITPAVPNASSYSSYSTRPTGAPQNPTLPAFNTTITANITLNVVPTPGQSYSLSTFFSSYGSAQEPPATLTPTIFTDQASSGYIPMAFIRIMMALTATAVVGTTLGVFVDI